jgi:hypothetical protein
LPKDIWGSISTYYYNNKENLALEEWDQGALINWWEADVYLIGIPWELKKYWQVG